MKDKLLTMTIALFPLTIILGTGLILLVVKMADAIDQSPEIVLGIFGCILFVFAIVWFYRFITEK